MSFTGMLYQTAVIHHVSASGTLDDHNKPQEQDTTTTVKTFIEQISVDEDTFLRDTGRTSVRAYFMPDVVIDQTDRLDVDGVTYEVLGPPEPMGSPRIGGVHHLEVLLTRAV